LPTGAPTDWAQPARAIGRRARSTQVPQRILRLDAARAAKKLEKRANSQQLSGLKKQGALRFEARMTAEQLAQALPDLTAWFDAHAQDIGQAPRFSAQPQEQAFWAALPRECPCFGASGLWVEGQLAAVVLGVQIRERFHVAWGVDNPAFESHAPSQILWLMLEEALLAQGVKDSDITAGFDWMHLGAADIQQTQRISLLFDTRARVSHDASQKALNLGRWALRLIDR